MSAVEHTGLSSLSAAYTDSEGEEVENNDIEHTSPYAKSNTESAAGTPSITAGKDTSSPPQKPPQLVAYETDAAAVDLSDEEKDNGNWNPQPMDISDEDSDLEALAEKEAVDPTPVPSPVRPIPKQPGESILPPEPTGHCSKALQDKINEYYKMMRNGVDMTRKIEVKKEYRNPSIYEKLLTFCDINEVDTNYPANLYNPDLYGPESYYEELAKTQKIEMDKREKERREKTRIEFVSGTKKSFISSIEEDLKKRKSKWDQVGSSGMSAIPSKPAGAIPIMSTTGVNPFGLLSKMNPPTTK